MSKTRRGAGRSAVGIPVYGQPADGPDREDRSPYRGKPGLFPLVLVAVLTAFFLRSLQGGPMFPERTPREGVGTTLAEPAFSAEEDWRLILVNPWNPIPESYEVTLTQLKNNQSVDERCYPDLQDMMDDCRGAGLSPLICSSYRTQEIQERLYGDQVNQWIAQGYSREEAELQARRVVAVPGTSEHQLGLAVDIVDVDNQNLDESQERTAVQRWLMEHSWEYGFILRYPSDKSAATGIVYEPWHYRYVGREAAGEIHRQGICLEEYLEQWDG